MVYFMVDPYIDENSDIHEYEQYMKEVKDIVLKYHGQYLVRTNHVISLHEKRKPQRVIVIRFDTLENLNQCFSSQEYKQIERKRINSVDSRAIIVKE